MGKYQKKVNFLKRAQLVLIIVCVIAICTFFYLRFKPQITNYQIEDICGPIAGRLSHSINDVDQCRNACNAQCQSLDKEYYKSDYEAREIECNMCECFCKE
jgi:hypothetical protein